MPDDEVTFWAKSIYGGGTDRPLVELGWGEDVHQVSPDEARAIAVSIFEAAESAETDAFIVQWLRGKIGLEIRGVAQVLRDFREWRARRPRRPPLGQG